MGNFRGSDDYVDVKDRLQDFYDTYPSGSLQTVSWDVKTVTGYRDGEAFQATFVVYHAAAYRTPDDTRPGMGMSWEPFPGLTNFTRNSELENAETSGWGRAIVSLGIAASKGLATRQEVRNRIAEQSEVSTTTGSAETKAKPARVAKLTDEERVELGRLFVASKWSFETLCLQLVLVGAIPDKSAASLGDNPTEDAYRALVGPVMGSLTPEQGASLRRSLADSIEADATQPVPS